MPVTKELYASDIGGKESYGNDIGRELNESDTGRKGSFTRVTWLFCYQGALTAFL